MSKDCPGFMEDGAQTTHLFSSQCAHSALTAAQQQLYFVDIDPLHKCPLDFFHIRDVRDTFIHTHNRWQPRLHRSTLKHETLSYR